MAAGKRYRVGYDVWRDDTDGTAVKFERKPPQATIDALRGLGLRYDWGRFVWYGGRMPEDELRIIIEKTMEYVPAPHGEDKGTGMW